MKIIHLMSGGLDSTVLLYDLLAQKHTVRCLMFNYGQRHLSELRYAKATCNKLRVPYDEVELARIKNLFLRCRLTDGKGSDVVPNRNGVFLNIACAISESLKFDAISFACNADDWKFPDCQQLFVHAVNTAFRLGEMKTEILMPYSELCKASIVAKARLLNVPLEETMSCYEGNNCGKCAACKLRKKALSCA